MKRLWIFGFFIMMLGFSVAVSPFSNPSSQSSFSGQSSTNWQSYQPTFNQLYSGDFSNYWPILNEMKNGQCTASTDFIIGIPPMGCSPSVVTSDLLAEQNVPVFCKLYAIKINPLIKASSIRSISFKGKYPAGVQSVVFHPARAAVKSYSVLIGSPTLENIGYVVIILKRNSIESNLTRWIAGNLTASMTYDADEAYGTGRSDYYLEPMSENAWNKNYAESSFWKGKGYLRVSDISGGKAKIQIMSDKNKIFRTMDLKVGETSSSSYLPGFYCKAGLKVKLDGITTQENMALLNVDGQTIWVRQGDSFLDGQCTVQNLDVKSNNNGEIKIYCSGTGSISPLVLRASPVKLKNKMSEVGEYYVGSSFDDKFVVAYGKLSKSSEDFVVLFSQMPKSENLNKINELIKDAKNFTNFAKGVQKLSGMKGATVLSDKSNKFVGFENTLEDKGYDNPSFDKSVKIVEGQLVAHYGREKRGVGETWGEDALYSEIVLARQLKKFKTEKKLMDLFLKKYPLSKNSGYVRKMRAMLEGTDYSNSVVNVYVGNSFKSISVVDFKSVGEGKKSVDLVVGALSKELGEGKSISLRSDWNITVQKITPGIVQIAFHSTKVGVSSRTVYIKEGARMVLDGISVYVKNINVKEVAHLSLIPDIKHDSSDANFTFRIGIEKRLIQLSPQKTEEMISNLNESIKKWQNIVDRLGGVVRGLKGACFATSAILMIKNMASGIGGEVAARQKVMNGKYKQLCDTQYPRESRTKCYNDLSKQINKDVSSMTAAIKESNNMMKAAQKNNIGDSGGIVGGRGIINGTKYMNELRGKINGKTVPVNISQEEIDVPVSLLSTPTQIQAVLAWQEAKKHGVGDIAKIDMDNALRNVALYYKSNSERREMASQLSTSWGVNINPNHISLLADKKTTYYRWTGETGKDFGLKGKDAKKKVHTVQTLSGKNYLVVLGSEADGKMAIIKVLEKTQTGWKENATVLAELRRENIAFLSVGDSKSCSNRWTRGNAKVSYYSSGKNKGLPAIVPFDLNNGWYAMVSNSAGTLIDNSPQGYTASGDVKYFKICNIGPNRLMQSGIGDDLCQTFSIDTFSSVDSFLPCPNMKPSEVSGLYQKARMAIKQVASQYGNKKINILDQGIFNVGKPMSAVSNFECQDFMSPGDCKLMFNVCDPVICPPSRCDLGGKFPVSNVIQTGIIGSLVLCLPNEKEGILMPICLSGVQAGLDGYLSILKSERGCLSHSLKTGQMIGICDQITSIYKCEFFWGQISPLMDQLIPGAINYAINGGNVRGGGEYASVAHSWDIVKQGFSYFKNVYAQNAFRAFNIRSTKEIGSSFCKAFIGTTAPSSANFIDNLLKPESPTQFYAEFSENLFTDATVPSTSQYKVYYHIYAGKDQGVQYKIYLKNPPASSYYASNPEVDVPTKTGYIAAGKSADESIDFTAPSGYKELCVVINAKEECGFKQVTSNFGIDFLSKKYVKKQAEDNSITTEKRCVSGAPSVLSMASLNLQSGAEEVANPNIAMRGIVRVCASENPAAGVIPGGLVACKKDGDCGLGFNCSSSGYCASKSNPSIMQKKASKWKDVGYCGNARLRCWLDVDSVKGDLQEIQDVGGVPIKILSEREGLIENVRLNLQGVRALLSKSRADISKLIIGNSGFKADALKIIKNLYNITGNNDKSGAGTNGDRAEALSLQASVYRLLALANIEKDVVKNQVPRMSVIVSNSPDSSSSTPIKEKEQTKKIPLSSSDIEKIMAASNDCSCGGSCKTYAKSIVTYSKKYGVDPLMALAVMIQESGCDYTKVNLGGDSYGLMQIQGASFENICKGKLASGNAGFVYINNKLPYANQNIECGIKILAKKYEDYKAGVEASWAWRTAPSEGGFSKNVRKCIETTQKEYSGYKGWDAAIRGYNGWGCGTNADVNYVGKVNSIYNKLKTLSTKNKVSIENSNRWTLESALSEISKRIYNGKGATGYNENKKFIDEIKTDGVITNTEYSSIKHGKDLNWLKGVLVLKLGSTVVA